MKKSLSSIVVAWIAVLLHVCRLHCLLQNNSTMRPSPPTHPSSQPSPQHPQPPPPPHSQMMSTQVSLIQHIHTLSKTITHITSIIIRHLILFQYRYLCFYLLTCLLFFTNNTCQLSRVSIIIHSFIHSIN